MYNSLNKILNNEFDELTEKVSKYNVRLNIIRPIYTKIFSKGKNFKTDNLTLFLDSKQLERCIDEIGILDKDEIISLVNIRKQYLDYEKNISKFYYKNNEEDDLTLHILYDSIVSTGDSKKMKLKEYSDFKKREELLQRSNEELENMLIYTCDCITEEYDSIAKDKEATKSVIRDIKFIIDCIKEKSRINPALLAYLTELIEEAPEEEKIKAYKELESFNIAVAENEAIIKAKIEDSKAPKKIIKQAPIVHFDDEEQIESKEVEVSNDLIILRSLPDEKSIIEYLDKLSYSYDINVFISKIFKSISVNDDLYKILNNYLNSVETIEDDAPKDTDIILYYGVTEGKNVILNDIESLSEDDYKHAYKALEMIRNGSALAASKSIKKLKKAMKLREDHIRIVYKRLFDNVYVILGIYRKKNSRGNEIVENAIIRNDSLELHTNLILKLLSSDFEREQLIQKNNQFEEEINTKLKSKIK